MILAFLYLLTGSVVYLLFTTELAAADHAIENVRFTVFVLMLPIFIKYIVQLLSVPVYAYKNAKGRSFTVLDRLPRVSVLIPAWNEEVGIIKTVQSVVNTHYPNLEIVVINDGSTDGTHALVTDYISKYDKQQEHAKANIKYLCLSNGGKAKALNNALDCASGEFILTIDADSVMDSKAIKNVLKQFEDQHVGAVAGNVIVGNRRKNLALLQQLEYMYGFFFKRADSVFNAVYIIGGASAAYRKSTLEAVGGFDEDIITEDIEMSTRILAHGFKTRYAADAVVYTEGPVEWRGLCKQRLRWKFGRLLTFLKHRKLFFSIKANNPYLTFMLLPVAIYAEFLLLVEPVLFSLFYTYTIYMNDYVPLVFMILFMGALVCLQVWFDSKARFHRNMLCLAPVAWVLFYVIDLVEFQALVRSFKRFVTRQSLEWQSWNRVGLKHNKFAEKAPSMPIPNRDGSHLQGYLDPMVD